MVEKKNKKKKKKKKRGAKKKSTFKSKKRKYKDVLDTSNVFCCDKTTVKLDRALLIITRTEGKHFFSFLNAKKRGYDGHAWTQEDRDRCKGGTIFCYF